MLKYISPDYSYDVDNKNNEEWTSTLQLFFDASLFQTYYYAAIHWNEKEISHLICRKKNTIIAAAQIRTIKFPLFKTGIAYVRYGPIWKPRDCPPDPSHFSIALKSLVQEFCYEQGLLLKIIPNIIDGSDESQVIYSMLIKDGFRLNHRRAAYRSFILDLSPPLEVLRKNLDQKWRNQLNRAEKNNLSLAEGTSDELFSTFLELQKNMQQRKKYISGVDYKEFQEMQKVLPESHKLKIIICKDSTGSALSATIVSNIGNCGIYLLGATGDAGMKAKGSYFSQWHIIKWLKNSGFAFYDLGGIDPFNNPGVYHFKQGISGKEVSFIGEFDKCKNNSILWGFACIEYFIYFARIFRKFIRHKK
jgi:FemAB family